MPEESPTEATDSLATRLSTIENALKLDERLKTLEGALAKRGLITAANPWWRDAKTVTILGAFLAAVIPLVTAIQGALKNWGDSQIALIEKQDKIRQTYLDRVLKPGITEDEQRRIFNLLSRLKSDPELQEWAKEQHDKTVAKIDDLVKQVAKLDDEKKDLIAQIEAEKQKSISAAGRPKPLANPKVKRLESALEQTRAKAAEIQRRIGASGGGKGAMCAGGISVSCGLAAVSCTCMDNVGCVETNSSGQVTEIPCPSDNF